MDDNTLRHELLRQLGNGVEYTPEKGGRLKLIGRKLTPTPHPYFLSHAERQHPNRGNWRNPSDGKWSYPEARRDV